MDMIYRKYTLSTYDIVLCSVGNENLDIVFDSTAKYRSGLKGAAGNNVLFFYNIADDRYNMNSPYVWFSFTYIENEIDF